MKCQHEPSSNIHHNQVKVSHEERIRNPILSIYCLTFLSSFFIFLIHAKPHGTHFTDSFLCSFFFFVLNFLLTGGSSERVENKSQVYYIFIFREWKRTKRRENLSLSNLISNGIPLLKSSFPLFPSLFTPRHDIGLFHHLSSNDIPVVPL